MMILVASRFRPSWEPDEHDLSGALELALREHGHEVESIRIPFDQDRELLWRQLFALRMANVSDVADLLVATGTPCHLLRHRRKVLWLTEHYPWLEDGSGALESLRPADHQAYSEASALFAASERLCDRVGRSSGLAVGPLPPPPEGSWELVVKALTGHHGAGGDR
jgi:hypothetical protein